MTDAQIIAIAITVLAVLGGTIVNNTRIGDVKEVLRAEFRADMSELRASMDKRFDAIDRKLDEILRILADHETRITRLEQRPG